MDLHLRDLLHLLELSAEGSRCAFPFDNSIIGFGFFEVNR